MRTTLFVVLILGAIVFTGCKAKKEDPAVAKDSVKTEEASKEQDTALTMKDLLDSNKVKEEKEKLKQQFDEKKKQLDQKMDEVQKELDKLGK